jgi:hypothetical protein
MVPIKPGTFAGGANRLADGYCGAFTRKIRPGVAAIILSLHEESYPLNGARILEQRVIFCVQTCGREHMRSRAPFSFNPRRGFADSSPPHRLAETSLLPLQLFEGSWFIEIGRRFQNAPNQSRERYSDGLECRQAVQMPNLGF